MNLGLTSPDPDLARLLLWILGPLLLLALVRAPWRELVARQERMTALGVTIAVLPVLWSMNPPLPGGVELSLLGMTTVTLAGKGYEFVRIDSMFADYAAIADRPHTELHTEMRAMGSGMFGKMELGKKELMAAMKEAKDPTSLKALWKAWLNDDAKYLVETAEVWEPLDALLKEVRNMK